MRLQHILLVFLGIRQLLVQSFAPLTTSSLGLKQHQDKRHSFSFPLPRPPTRSTSHKHQPYSFYSNNHAAARTQLYNIAPGATTATDNLVTWASMAALAIQSGSMPTLQKKCIHKDICRSAVVIAQEIGKFSLSAICLFLVTNSAQRQAELASWSIRQWWQLAGIPAALFAIQSYAKLIASQHLPAVTFSVLNQTKTLSAAVFCYLFLGIRQSPLQMAALLLLVVSALIIEEVVTLEHFKTKPSKILKLSSRIPQLSIFRWKTWEHRHQNVQSTLFSSPKNDTLAREPKETGVDAGDDEQAHENENNNTGRDRYHVTRGVIPLVTGNLASGLASAWGQRALQHHKRNLYLYSMEMSSATILIILFTLLWSKDGRLLQNEGVTKHWTKTTWLPIGGQAIGGLLVGLVTKYAGAVPKGFALIFGVLISGLLQKLISQEDVTNEQVFGGILTCVSVWLYSSFPPS